MFCLWQCFVEPALAVDITWVTVYSRNQQHPMQQPRDMLVLLSHMFPPPYFSVVSMGLVQGKIYRKIATPKKDQYNVQS